MEAMEKLTLAEAQTIVRGALEQASNSGMKPETVAVLDDGGHLITLARQDGASFLFVKVATAKAWTALALRNTSRSFDRTASERPSLVSGLMAVSGGQMVPAAGGLCILRGDLLIGAVGVSGDSPDTDEGAALAGVRSSGLGVVE